MNLDEIRHEIDVLDKQIIELLKKRMSCSLDVARWKIANGKPVLDSRRETEILNEAEQQGGKFGDAVRGVYTEIMKQSRELQHRQMTDE